MHKCIYFYATHPLSDKYLAAGLTLEMLPAGEMWSVVTESPRFNKTYASLIGATGVSSCMRIITHIKTLSQV